MNIVKPNSLFKVCFSNMYAHQDVEFIVSKKEICLGDRVTMTDNAKYVFSWDSKIPRNELIGCFLTCHDCENDDGDSISGLSWSVNNSGSMMVEVDDEWYNLNERVIEAFAGQNHIGFSNSEINRLMKRTWNTLYKIEQPTREKYVWPFMKKRMTNFKSFINGKAEQPIYR